MNVWVGCVMTPSQIVHGDMTRSYAQMNEACHNINIQMAVADAAAVSDV